MMPIVVYEHWRPDLNRPFYIGSGSRQRAGAITGHRHSARYRAVLDELTALGLKPEVRIIFEFDDEATACNAEANLIRSRQRRGIELVNQHNRGVRILSPEARDKMRLSPGRPLIGDVPLSQSERMKRWRAKRMAAGLPPL